MELFTVHTDGDRVWVRRGGAVLAQQQIGQDIDGPEVAMQMAVVEVVRKASSQVRLYELYQNGQGPA